MKVGAGLPSTMAGAAGAAIIEWAKKADMRTRGRRFDRRLATMRRVWAGEPFGDGAGKIVHPPARAGVPEALIGAATPPALARAARRGDGFIAAGDDPNAARASFDFVLADWRDAGGSGEPRDSRRRHTSRSDQTPKPA